MRRIKLIIEYDGTHFAGLQVQGQGERTVQSELELALGKIPGAIAKIWACGRTDSGVHALAMPIHYDTEDSIPADKIPFALNTLLPPDIRALSAEEAEPDFHARKSCCWREYRYRILLRRLPPAIQRDRVWWVPQSLNLIPMRHAVEYLVGTHDFKAFAVKEERETTRQIYRSHLEVWPTLDGMQGRELWLTFVGSGFVRNQVRSMVGTLVEVGLGKRDSQNVQQLLESGTRSEGGVTAPAQGLYFVQAGYRPYERD